MQTDDVLDAIMIDAEVTEVSLPHFCHPIGGPRLHAGAESIDFASLCLADESQKFIG
jgi:hypothetical protein